MSKFFITCDESSSICDKNQYGEAGFSDKIKMMVHIIKCKVCKCYSEQNTVMTKVYSEYASKQCKKEKCLCEEDKLKLQKAVEERMN